MSPPRNSCGSTRPLNAAFAPLAKTSASAGKDIRKGQILHIMIGAANRDPDQFEQPDRLIITRSPNRHVSLGHGVHYCLGAALARLELRIAVASFLARYPNYRLASDNIVFMDRTASRRPTSVPVFVR